MKRPSLAPAHRATSRRPSPARIAALLALLCLPGLGPASQASDALILPMRERAVVIDRWLEDRVQTVLPGIMRRAGLPC